MTDYRAKIAALTDEQLHRGFEVAKHDLSLAAQNEPETEWHEACFAAVLVYSLELSKRGLVNRALH